MAQQFVKKIGTWPIEVITPRQVSKTRYEAMQIVADETKNHFVKGFRTEGGQTDASKAGWKARKDNTGGEGRNILTGHGGGDLARDIDVKKVSANTAIIGTSRIPYAATHNEGLVVPERRARLKKSLHWMSGGQDVFAKSAKAFTMPKREFIGPSKELTQNNLKRLAKLMGKPLKPHL